MSNPERVPENKVFSLQDIISVLSSMDGTAVREKLEELVFYLSDNKTTLFSALESRLDLNKELEDFFYEQIEYGQAHLKIPLQFGDKFVNLNISARIGYTYHITLESDSKSSEIKQRWNNIPQVKERSERVKEYVKMYSDLQKNRCFERSSYYIEIVNKEARTSKDEDGEILLHWQTFKYKGRLNERFTEWITNRLNFIFSYSKEGVPVWNGFELPFVVRVYESPHEDNNAW